MATNRKAKLLTLAKGEGFDDVHDMLQAAIYDSVCPGICTNDGCNYTIEVEPDQREGWCESCHTNTVASGMVLAGII